MNNAAELIKKTAEEIVSKNILYNWKFYGIIIALSIIAFSVYSFAVPYLRSRGKQYARKSDIDAILEELKKTTHATEEIKSDVEKGIWIKKEWNILRRQKLEELLLWLYEFKKQAHQRVQEFNTDEYKTDVVIPYDRATAVYKLYFPELDKSMEDFNTAYSSVLGLMSNFLQYKKNNPSAPFPTQEQIDNYGKCYQKIVFSISAIENEARTVMDGLRNI